MSHDEAIKVLFCMAYEEGVAPTHTLKKLFPRVNWTDALSDMRKEYALLTEEVEE